MARHRRVWLLCVAILPCAHSRASDDLAALLWRTDVVARGYQGEFETFGGEERPGAALDFRTDGLKRESMGRIWLHEDDVLVEFLADPGTSPPRWDGRRDNVVRALAASKVATFDFLAAASPSSPRASLKVHPPDQPQWVRDWINTQVIHYLNALSCVNGFKVETLLLSGRAVVRYDPAKDRHSVIAEFRDASRSTAIIHELTVVDRIVRCASKLTAGPPASAITIETLAEGELPGEATAPRRVARRITGPGRGASRREVAYFTPRDLGRAPFPITAEFFQQYERDRLAPVRRVSLNLGLDSDPGMTPEPWEAKRRLIFAAAGLLAATVAGFGAVQWLRARRSG